MASKNHTTSFNLPSDLSTLTLQRFDKAHADGKLIYGPSTSEIFQHEGFTVNAHPIHPPVTHTNALLTSQFCFSIPPAISSKPVLPPNDPSRSKPGGPFLHPDPDMVLCAVGPSHTLELNKHCVLRPMSILHTKEYEKQKDDLEVEDMRATWAVMGQLGKEGQEVMAIYNCGAEAGASQGHKHLQIFPRPSSHEFELYPGLVRLEEGKAMSCEGVPYKHFVMPIPSGATAEDVYTIYEQLLDRIRPILREHGTEDYNMILVKEWMLVIPRRRHGREGVKANAVGMMGWLWLKGKEERDGWARFGYTEHLKWLGVPP